MRTKKAFLNTIIGLFATLIATILSFYLNKVFLSTLGLEYLGLNGIFSNALGMLSLTEMGIGIAISYELYVPIAHNDTRKIAALINLYKKIFYIIATITFIVGLIVGVFICTTVHTSEINAIERFVYFFLFLCNNCCTYLLSYKRTLLEADQKSYVISAITSFVTIISTFIKILLLYFMKSYISFIIISIIQTITMNIILSLYIDHNYSFIKKSKEKLDKHTSKNIFLEVKSRILIKLCNVLVSSTDNVIIGSVISVTSAGLFQNYYFIVIQLSIFINQIGNAVTPSLGNYTAIESKENLTDIITELEFLNHCIGTFCFTCFCILISPFMNLWLGNYLLPFTVPFLLIFDLYLTTIRDVHWKVNNMTVGFKNNKRVYFHIIRATFNLIGSLLGAIYFGISGVVLGTVLSSIVIWCAEAIYTYRIVLGISIRNYIIQQFFYIFQTIVIYCLVYLATSMLEIENLIFDFLSRGVITLVITISLLCVMNINNPYLHRLLGRVKTIYISVK